MLKDSQQTQVQQRIEVLYKELLASPEPLGGLEADLVQQFIEIATIRSEAEDRLPCSPLDTIVREQVFKLGRADIVIYHVDGSISVIEAKDGSAGYSAVVAGIGQVTLYAVQIGMGRIGVPVRRCLLWSGTNSVVTDAIIEEVCRAAGVLPLPYPPMRKIMAVRAATGQSFQEIADGATQEG